MMRPGGPQSTDLRNKGAIREGGMEKSGTNSDDELDAYLEGYEEPTADEDQN